MVEPTTGKSTASLSHGPWSMSIQRQGERITLLVFSYPSTRCQCSTPLLTSCCEDAGIPCHSLWLIPSLTSSCSLMALRCHQSADSLIKQLSVCSHYYGLIIKQHLINTPKPYFPCSEVVVDSRVPVAGERLFCTFPMLLLHLGVYASCASLASAPQPVSKSADVSILLLVLSAFPTAACWQACGWRFPTWFGFVSLERPPPPSLASCFCPTLSCCLSVFPLPDGVGQGWEGFCRGLSHWSMNRHPHQAARLQGANPKNDHC